MTQTYMAYLTPKVCKNVKCGGVLRQMFCLVVICICLLVLKSCREPDPLPDDMVQTFLKDEDVPGMFVAVVKHDSVLFRGAFGLADKDQRIPMTDTTCMELGSISKAFAGEVLYELQSKKLIGLSDPIGKYLKDAPASWSSITINDLFCHTSGIQNYLLDPRFKAAEYFQGNNEDRATADFFNSVPVDSMVGMFYSLPIEFKAGESWAYSNTGYYLLGKIIESVSGKPFFELAASKLTRPLFMSHTKPNELAAAEGCMAKGYFKKDGQLRRAPYVLTSHYAFSAGAWSTSGRDMINYLKAIHAKKLPSDLAGLDWRIPPSPARLPFSYVGGRFYSKFHGITVISHNGGTPGFSSSWIYLVEPAISVIVLMNRQDYAAIDQLTWDILSLFEPAISYPKDPLKNAVTEKYTQRLEGILKYIGGNDSLPAGLSKPLRIFLEGDNGRGLWQWVLERGIPGQAHCVDMEDIGEYKAYRFRLPLSQKVEYRMTMLVGQNDEVVQLWWW